MSAKSDSSINVLVKDEAKSECSKLVVGITIVSFLVWVLNVFLNTASTLLVRESDQATDRQKV